MNHGERTSHLTTQYNYAVVEVELELWERFLWIDQKPTSTGCLGTGEANLSCGS